MNYEFKVMNGSFVTCISKIHSHIRTFAHSHSRTFAHSPHTRNNPALLNVLTGLLSQNNSKSSRPAVS